MSAEFYTILPPPQSLETLDNWGNLDALPLSLDNPAWGAAGIYGLTVEGVAASGGSLSAKRICKGSGNAYAQTMQVATSRRIRSDAFSSGVATSEICLPLRKRLISGTSVAVSGGSLRGTVSSPDSLAGTASTGESFAAKRIREAVTALSVQSGQSVKFARIRAVRGSGGTVSGGSFKAVRLRFGSGVGKAESAVSASFFRWRLGSGAGEAVAGGSLNAQRKAGLTATGVAQSAVAAAFSRIRIDSLTGTAKASGWLSSSGVGRLFFEGLATSGDSFKAVRLLAPAKVDGRAESGLSIVALRIRRDVTSGTAKSAESVTAARIRTKSAKATATSSEAAQWLRFRQDVFRATATLSGTLQATLLGNDRIYGYAYSGGAFEGQRTRTALAILTAATSGTESGSSVRGLTLRGKASASGQLSAESGIQLKAAAKSSGSMRGMVLGHDWQGKTRPQDAEWGEKTTVLNPWQGQQENTAEWAHEGAKHQGWTADKAGASAWVNYGDEQSGSGIWSMGAGCRASEWTASARGEELHPGKTWVQANERPCSDDIPCSGWASFGCGEPAAWRRLADVGGNGWRPLRS